MNVDRYTKAVLTVIAGCLLWICAMGAGPSLAAQSVATRKIPNSSIQPVILVGTGTLDQEGTVTVNFVRYSEGKPRTDPTLPIQLPYTPAKPLPVSLPYTPEKPMPSLVVNPADAPVPMELQGVRKPAGWEPLRVRVEDAPAKPKPGGGER
jgi:hypothetical protein